MVLEGVFVPSCVDKLAGSGESRVADSASLVFYVAKEGLAGSLVCSIVLAVGVLVGVFGIPLLSFSDLLASVMLFC